MLTDFITFSLTLSSVFALNYTFIPNFDTPGNDIKYYQGNWTDCSTACDEISNCVGYIPHVDNGKNCWLKSLVSNGKTTNQRHLYYNSRTSSPTNLKRTYQVKKSFDYPYNDIAFLDIPFEQCPSACDNMPDCKVFVLRLESGSGCWFKTKLENKRYASVRDTYSVLPFDSVPNLLYTFAKNLDAPGNDILYWTGNISECAGICNEYEKCVGYVPHTENGKNCWLKSSLTTTARATVGRDVYFNNRTESPLKKSRTYSVKKSWDFPGNDVAFMDIPFDQCPLACDNFPGCTSYVLRLESNTGCWLKSKTEDKRYVPIRDTFSSDPFAPTPALQYKLAKNLDAPGSDIIYFNGNFSECAGICNEYEKCVGYVPHTENGKNCWLKSSLTTTARATVGRDVYFNNRTESPLKKSRTYSVKKSWDFPGNDVAFMDIPFDQCPLACDNFPGCTSYVLRLESNTGCWLKSKLESKTLVAVRDTYTTEALPMAAVPNLSYKLAPLFDAPGGDIAYYQGNISDCSRICNEIPDCVGYVPNSDLGRNCWLKSALLVPRVTLKRELFFNNRTTNPVVADSRSYSKQKGTDYPGNDLGYYDIAHGLCGYVCDNTIGCSSYVLNMKASQGCWLKSKLENGTSNPDRDTFTVAKNSITVSSVSKGTGKCKARRP